MRQDWGLSERWQALAAVLPPEGPKGPRVSRRRAQGRARQDARLGACQCYYMFFTVQPKIAIFVAQLTYLNDDQNAPKLQWTFILATLTSCKKIREIHQSGEKLWKVEISQK